MALNVYVVHVKALRHRKALCEKLRTILENSPNLALGSFVYIDDMDPGEPLPNVPINTQPFPEGPLQAFNALIRPLKVAHITNALKHIKALEAIANGEEDVGLVVEDDIAFRDTIAEDIQLALANFKGGGGFTFLGAPPTVGSSDTGSQPLSQVYNFAPCCDSYIVDRATAASMLNHMLPIRFPTNLQLSFALSHLKDVIPKIAVPNVFVDGTKLGLYLSAIDANSKMVFSEQYAKCAQNWNTPNFDPANFDKIDPKWHPEVLHLKAQYEAKKGNYQNASDLYQRAIDAYDAHGGILDNSSELLRNAMRLYRYLQ